MSGGRDFVDGGDGADTLIVTGTNNHEHFYVETVAAYDSAYADSSQ